MAGDQENTISVDQLQVGVYVYLDVGWMDHPFGFNKFKIKSDDQIRIIRQIGLKTVRWDPDRSDQKPLPLAEEPEDAHGPRAGIHGSHVEPPGLRAGPHGSRVGPPGSQPESPPLRAEAPHARAERLALRAERLAAQAGRLAGRGAPAAAGAASSATRPESLPAREPSATPGGSHLTRAEPSATPPDLHALPGQPPEAQTESLAAAAESHATQAQALASLTEAAETSSASSAMATQTESPVASAGTTATSMPSSAAPAESATPAGHAPAGPVDEIMAAKLERVRRLAEHREQRERVEQVFLKTAQVVRAVSKTIFSQPAKTLAEANQLIGQMVDNLLAAPSLAIQVMNENPTGDDVYLHTLNVAVLSMILGRELELPAEDVRTIGLGALFHDIGLAKVPSTILQNPGPLTKAEREFRELHCDYGLEIGKKAGLPPGALHIIYEHHEHFDGGGYPRKLKGEAIDHLARIVTIVNAYDNLCNPVNVNQAVTPHEALSQMFSAHRNHFDPKLLQLFIRFMGVYPPGTVVAFSNDAIGLVISVNAARPLKPTVVVYDPEVPREEAIVLDLEEEPDINITKAIRPNRLLPKVFDYLRPRRRVSYYFDPGSRPAGDMAGNG